MKRTLAIVTLAGSQAYPRFARVAFRGDGPDRSVQWTGYLHLDGEGKIACITRFEGDFPVP